MVKMCLILYTQKLPLAVGSLVSILSIIFTTKSLKPSWPSSKLCEYKCSPGIFRYPLTYLLRPLVVVKAYLKWIDCATNVLSTTPYTLNEINNPIGITLKFLINHILSIPQTIHKTLPFFHKITNMTSYLTSLKVVQFI